MGRARGPWSGIGVALALGWIGCSSDGGAPDGPAPADLGDGAVVVDRPLGDRGPALKEGPRPDQGKSDTKPWPTKPCGFKVGTGSDIVGGTNVGFSMGGQPRDFVVQRVNVPAGYSGKLPVVFAFHGYGSKAVNFAGGSAAEPGNKPHLKVLPQAIGAWDFASNPADSRDIRFFDEMIGCLNAQFSVDNDRIHVLGVSYGGLFAGYALGHRGTLLGATTFISGGLIPATSGYSWPVDQLIAKLTNKPAALIVWGGQTDQAAGYDFHQAALEATKKLRANGQTVVQCNHNTGHEWPTDFNRFIYFFFEDHARGVKPEPYAGGLPAAQGWPSYCKVAP